jgi:hypothetical protein
MLVTGATEPSTIIGHGQAGIIRVFVLNDSTELRSGNFAVGLQITQKNPDGTDVPATSGTFPNRVFPNLLGFGTVPNNPAGDPWPGNINGGSDEIFGQIDQGLESGYYIAHTPAIFVGDPPVAEANPVGGVLINGGTVGNPGRTAIFQIPFTGSVAGTAAAFSTIEFNIDQFPGVGNQVGLATGLYNPFPNHTTSVGGGVAFTGTELIVTVIPEPSTVFGTCLALVVGGCVAYRRRKLVAA